MKGKDITNYPYTDLNYKVLADGRSIDISQGEHFVIITKENLQYLLEKCIKGKSEEQK